jgi:hypothetical protein
VATTDRQAWGREELRRVARENPGSLTILQEHPLDADGTLRTTIRLPTGELVGGAGGLPVQSTEDVTIAIGRSFPRLPPVASVDHERFVDCSHVLQGERLCVYLDPDREWHPNAGIVGYLYALWKWFEDAVAGRFDAATALYHPVGGVLHQSPGSPTMVVREDLPAGSPVCLVYMVPRTSRRLDLHWTRPSQSANAVALVVAPTRLPFGAQLTLGGLVGALEQAGSSASRVLTAFAACARRSPDLDRQPFVLAIPNPATPEHFLLAGRLDPHVTAALRANNGRGIITIDSSALDPHSPIEWCAMSDERPEISTRRDAHRPVQALRGKTVHVWGCGGLGSWIAEFIVRAGAAHVAVSDPAEVTGGLLVRQNYTEDDIGENKAQALARRLRSLSDGTDVTVVVTPRDELNAFSGVDLLIDATVSNSVAHALDGYARSRGAAGPTIAAVATDPASATLGLMIVTENNYGAGPATVDEATKPLVLSDSDLARYHSLWREPKVGEELIPARGCSTPTFHGSAADLAGIAATLVNLLGQQMQAPANGTYLFAQTLSDGSGPPMKFVAAPAREQEAAVTS